MKKFLSLTLATVLAIGIALPTSATQRAQASKGFRDVPDNHWAYPYITAMADKGYIGGISGDYEDGTAEFNMTGTLTYAQFCSVIARAFYGDKVVEQEKIKTNDQWWDAPMQALYTAFADEPYANPVILNTKLYDVMIHKNLITGGLYDIHLNGNANFTVEVADMPITREDMANIIYTILYNSGAPIMDYLSALTWGDENIADWDNIAYGIEVANVYRLGIISGRDNGAFDPNATLNRAELATVLYRMCEKNLIPETTCTPSGEIVTEVITQEPGKYDVDMYNVPADTNKDGFITEAEVMDILKTLKEEYPDYTSWDDDTYYYSKSTMRSGLGCAAYAFMISDRIFGDLPMRVLSTEEEFTYKDIQVGDIFSNKNPHWGVFRDLSDSRHFLTTEGNVGHAISWKTGGLYTDIAKTIESGYTTIYTRYPQ